MSQAKYLKDNWWNWGVMSLRTVELKFWPFLLFPNICPTINQLQQEGILVECQPVDNPIFTLDKFEHALLAEGGPCKLRSMLNKIEHVRGVVPCTKYRATPWTDRHRYDWKHCLPATSLSNGKYRPQVGGADHRNPVAQNWKWETLIL